MPTYEYLCGKCGKNFDAFQSMRDDAFAICPQDKCQMETWGEGPVKRLIGTGAGLIFKGSGFYITDYRSENYKKGQKSETSGNAPAAGGSGEVKAAPAKTDSPTAAPAKTESAKPASPSPKPSSNS